MNEATIIANVMWYTGWPDAKFDGLITAKLVREARDLYIMWKHWETEK